MQRALARAKLNLALHVTGRRPDGYHLLDSLVVFADIGDVVEVEASDRLSLTLDGPFATDVGAGGDNLVMRAARMIAPPGVGAAIKLTKTLPVAAGLGGGSADAAAALNLLAQHWSVALPPADRLAEMGADVPVCTVGASARMRGIGELLTPVALPPLWVVLANDGRGVPTGSVFAALKSRTNPELPDIPRFADTSELIRWTSEQRNDLEPAALRVQPGIGDVLSALRAMRGCGTARMSGSGGTCFGMFTDEVPALAAAAALRRAEPTWWVVAAPVRSRPVLV